jgi:hypothetical protein
MKMGVNAIPGRRKSNFGPESNGMIEKQLPDVTMDLASYDQLYGDINLLENFDFGWSTSLEGYVNEPNFDLNSFLKGDADDLKLGPDSSLEADADVQLMPTDFIYVPHPWTKPSKKN